ncbi:MAG TPA: glycoside hydrolase family 3 N-terminal domain-containing protein [Ktedonobacterales bacterium]
MPFRLFSHIVRHVTGARFPVRIPSRIPSRAGFIRGLALLALCSTMLGACGQNAALVDSTLGGRQLVAAQLKSATPTPTAVPGDVAYTHALDLLADRQIASMSLDEELGQLFLADFIGSDYPANDAGMVEQYHAGGIILYSRSLLTADQARSMIAAAQAHAGIPLFVTLDEEGGGVDRLSTIFGPHPSARTMALSGSTDYTRQQGASIGADMMSLGLNLDFAPDVDVQLVTGPDLGSRNFGDDPTTVTTYAGAFLSGLQSTGAVGCVKHFPGLGAASIDAHLGLPLIDRTRQQIESVELAPYRNLIATGQVQCVMDTDLLMPALDPTLPAELSPTLINGVLRGELGYDGVVMTDALYMDGIAQRYSMPEAGVLAILAGNDVLEGPWTPDQMGAMVQALKAALASGRLTKARIDQSVRRILVLKMRMGLIPVPPSVTGGS